MRTHWLPENVGSQGESVEREMGVGMQSKEIRGKEKHGATDTKSYLERGARNRCKQDDQAEYGGQGETMVTKAARRTREIKGTRASRVKHGGEGCTCVKTIKR